MFFKKTAIRLSLSLTAALLIAAPAFAQESAWDEYVRRNPAAVEDDAVDPLMRKVLHALSPDQAAALFDGEDPEAILLASGETLGSFLRGSVGGGPGLVYVPVDQCRLFATAAQTAPVTGQMAADEIREFVARGAGSAHTDQGGMPDCMIPTEAVAVVTHFRVVASQVQDANGFLKVWPAGAPEPSSRVLDYEPVVDPPLKSRFRFNATVVVELCPAGVCATGEFNVKTADLAAHVRGDVAGYFRPIEAADVPGAGDADTLDGLDSTDFALAVHTHDGGDIVSGTVGEPYIDPQIARDSEVVDIVKAGDGAGSGIDADLLDGRDSLDLMLQVGNCLTVSPSCPAVPADALAARCWQTIQAAIDAADPLCVSDCLPAAAGPTNRYVIKVGPGIYTEQVTMIANVDVEGSGEKLTVITNTAAPTLNAANDTALTSLTVENTDGGTAIQASGASPMIKHVTARAAAGTGGAPIGVKLGMGAAPMLTHVTTDSAGDGVENNIAAVTIRDSVLGGSTNGIENVGAATSAVVNTQITGGASDGATGTTFTCLGAYDAAFAELDANCQP